MNKKFNKIFVIGYNKTATCSIDALLSENGLNSYHSGGLHEGDWDINKYDAFSDQHPDGTDFFRFRKCHQNYPNSLFILNTRKLKDWILSRCGHAIFHNSNMIEKDGFLKCQESWGYPNTKEIYEDNKYNFESFIKKSDFILNHYYDFIFKKIKFWTQERESYYASILHYFKYYSEDLILINIHKEWKSFLGDIIFEDYKISDDRMKTSTRKYSIDQKKFYDAHEEVYKQAIKDVFDLYPKFTGDSILLHNNKMNKYFLNVYKNNF